MNFRKLRKITAFTIMITMLLGIFPWHTVRVSAFDADRYRVNSVTVFKVYDENRQLEQRRIVIEGKFLKDADVGIMTSTGYQRLTNRTVNTEGLLQFDISRDQLGSSVLVEGFPIPINEGEMPTLTGVNRRIEIGTDDLLLQGTNLTKILNDSSSVAITAGYEHEGAYTPIDESSLVDLTDTSVKVPKPSGALGLQNIIFEKTEKLTMTFNDNNENVPVTVTVKYTYKDQFRFVQRINVDGLQMYPNRGSKGDKVYFEAPNPNLSNYDVFFLKKIDGTDSYTNKNKGKNKTFQQNVDGMDILAVEVPDLPVGEYYVVLTNPVSDTVDPMGAVVQELIVGTAPEYERFTVIDATMKAKVIGVQPSTGPDSGSKTTVLGQFLVSLNVPEYVPDSSEIEIEDPETDTNPQELVVSYAPGKYNGVEIKSAKRRIKVIIGGTTTFVKADDTGKYDVIANQDLDKMVVQTPQVTDAETDPKKDVVVETETVFTKADGSTIVIKERAELTDGYTYIPSKLTPEITDSVPDKIQVVSDGAGAYETPEDRMVAIHGKNFMIHKFTGSGGKEVVRYPIVEFGAEVGLNKNTTQNPGDPPSNPDIVLKVFDASGAELDGTQGSEIGTKILVIIPKGTKVSTLGKTYLKVSNPVRNSESTGLSAVKYDFIEFVATDANKNPVITSVTPSVSTTDGGETITVEGSNFASGVRVFLDGEEIKSVNRQGDGKKLTFTCPKGREGETQLQVMNPEGGMATWPFTYVKAYTSPKITDFSPKSGKTGTLVIIKGENFLKPEPTATEDSIYKLIGSRVLLEGTEVNEYNVNPTTKKIELKDYLSPDQNPILEIVEDEGGKYVQIADYYSGVILQDMDSGNFYTLDVDTRGNIVLSDGAGRNYTVQLNSSGTGLSANREGGDVVELTVEDVDDPSDSDSDPDYTVITIKESTPIRLKLRTLYKTDENRNIVGNRVKVVDRNRIYFTVPVLGADGYYDVTVINPDTSKDSKTDKQGFYYYTQPQSKPVITSIDPNEGSVDGGYAVKISGREFEDNGVTKTKVYLNGVEISGNDTVVSTDGTSITIIVPKYTGDLLQETGTSRLTVPVVVVNPDGGSFSIEKGFTYVVPTSYPKISKIVPQKGSASGGDVIEITGTDFRYYEPYDDVNRNQMWDPGETFHNLNGHINTKWDSEDDLMNDPEISERTELTGHSRYSYYYASPILPKVYFGSQQAKIVEFSRGYIKVIAPPGAAGKTDVFLVNNDGGISNKITFTYEASGPKINKILPAEGKKQGKDKVEIIGSDFEESTVTVYTGTVDSAGNSNIAQKNMALVRFGNISNRDIPREQDNSGRIDSGRTTVRLAGGLKIEYDGVNDTLDLTLEYNGTYSARISGYDDSVRYIPMSMLTNQEGDYCSAYELVRVEVSDRRLIVERGYSPQVEFINAGQLTVYTPSYYTVGKVPVTVINPDGGMAEGQFEYKNPASNPKITSITREGESPSEEEIDGRDVRVVRIDYKGGNIVSIIGEDFRDNAKVQISDVLSINPDSITYSLPNRLTFEMPSVPESAVGKLHRVVVLNEDGGFASSDELDPPIYIMFTKGDTTPVIDKITPEIGPASGGTVVKIEGKDFRESMEGFNKRIAVYFGEVKVPDSDVTVADYKTIYVTTPSNVPGKVEVRVENPDGVVTKPGGSFTYISDPNITAVVDPADPSETRRIKTISVKGGQEIKLKGSGFMEGAKVIFNPVLKEVDDEEQASGQVIYIDGKAYTLESGSEGTNVKFIDSETLTVVVPQGKTGTRGVMVINPDGGASTVYQDLEYGLPELTAPTGVHAELIYDRYIKITWKAVSGAREYEIYVVVDDNEIELIGSTQLTSFVYTDLEPRTRYRFIVKAVGDFGPSSPSEESNTVRTGSKAGPPDEDGGLNESTRMERSGNTANVTIGEEDFDDKAITIDLTRGSLAGCDEVVVSMSASVVAGRGAKDITVIGKDFRVKFNPAAFRTSRIQDNKKEEDAGVRFKISPSKGSSNLGGASNRGTSLSSQYMLEAYVFVGKSSTKMERLSSSIEIALDFNADIAETRKLSNISLSCYNEYEDAWIDLAYGISGSTSVSALTDKLGRYMVIGRRTL